MCVPPESYIHSAASYPTVVIIPVGSLLIMGFLQELKHLESSASVHTFVSDPAIYLGWRSFAYNDRSNTKEIRLDYLLFVSPPRSPEVQLYAEHNSTP